MEEIEPIVKEFATYVAIIFLVAGVTWVTEDFIPPKIKDVLNAIKYILIISIISIFSIRTIIIILIKAYGTINTEVGKLFSTNVEKELEKLKKKISLLEEKDGNIYSNETFEDNRSETKEKLLLKNKEEEE